MIRTFAASTLFAALALTAALPAQALTDRSGPFELQVLVDGSPARTFQQAGETFVLGHLGARYTLRLVNHSGRRIEAVVSVDGRDAIDGKPADWQGKRGYLVPAWGSAEIDGWRLSREEAAAFRFSTVPESYAGKTGNAREVGVIGVAIFPERWQQPPRPVYAPPAPPPAWNGAERNRSKLQPLKDDWQPSDARESGQPGQAPSAADAPPASSGAAPQADLKAAPEAHARRSIQRPGLGTEFGEAVPSRLTEVPFERAQRRPQTLLGVRYDDRAGLVALGIDVDGRTQGEADLRRSAEPFPVVERGYAEPPPGWSR